MKKHLLLLYMAIFTAMSLSLTACGDDDDEPDNPASNNKGFTFNNVKMYTRDSGYLEYSQRDDVLQLQFSLYKTSSPFNGDQVDIYAAVDAGIELEPFTPSTVRKGQEIKIICRKVGFTSTYTCIQYDYRGYTSSQVLAKYCFIHTGGKITVESYDVSNNTVTLKLNNVQFKGNASDEQCTLNGTVKCQYENDGFLTLYSGDFY